MDLDSCVVMLAGLLCEELLESVDDDDFEPVVSIFEDDAYTIVVDAVTKKVNIIMTAAKKLPLVISNFLL
ncbi:MAG: hypothetical protein WAZ77_19030 [Candidatus Nitrosopolaris sp.]